MVKNGKVRWIIALMVGILAIISAIVGMSWDASAKSSAIDSNKKDIAEVVEEIDAEIKPEMSKNSEHRIRFEERVKTMQKDIGKILTVVEKMSKNE